MKIQLFNFKEFIDLNNLKEVKSPILFQRGSTPDPDGLISNEIFGVDLRSRKTTFAYIKLNGHFFHPHIYKTFKRLYRNIERIVNGEFYYRIDTDGHIVEDKQDGVTGLESIYKNWEKIKWDYSPDGSGMRNERIDILTKSKKNEIFIEYCIVIPAFYRDIKNSGDGKGETDPLNNMYAKIIRLAGLLGTPMWDFTLHSTYYSIQTLLVEIYDSFKDKLAKKNGMIRKFLMGKNVDYCTRSVISTPNFHANNPNDMLIDFEHIGVPISQICSLCYPFMTKWLRDFFDKEFIQNQYTKYASDGELLDIKDPESYYTDDYIKKMMDQYIRNPEGRFDPILVPTENGFEKIKFTGMILDPHDNSELSSISDRYLTVTDILYRAAVDCTKDKNTLVTRYPVTDSYGVFLGKTRVISTLDTVPVKIGATVYKFYPNIDIHMDKRKIATKFIETAQFSNSYLKGIGGDYDGDQVTVKILWTQEANDEIRDILSRPSNFVTPTGANIRTTGNEAIQTLYSLTKNPDKNSRTLLPREVEEIVSIKAEEITFDTFVNLFGRKNVKENPRFRCNDLMSIRAKDFPGIVGVQRTTVGRFILNRFWINGLGFDGLVSYINYEMTDKALKNFEKQLCVLLTRKEITAHQMSKYLDYRDWIGLKVHPITTSSFTAPTLKIPPEVEKLKEKLLRENKEELDKGNNFVAEKIEKQLIEKTKEILDGDPGLDLYYSGARGSIENNLKNIILMRGAVINPLTGKYDIVKSSLMDGMKKEELPANSNSVVTGAYPKAVGTADSGYLSKQLLSGMQTEVIDEDGSSCLTEKTLDVIVSDKNISDCLNRNIKVNGKPLLLTTGNINSYKGKKVKMYSPMYCTGDKLCSKCAGTYGNKFIGLDTSKVATTLTNLNMKKFHNNVIKSTELKPNEILLLNKKEIFETKGNMIALKDKYCEFYIPLYYFDSNYNFAENLGDKINTFGVFNVGVFENGKLSYIDTLAIPSWIKVNSIESEVRNVIIPGSGEIPCKVIKLYQGNELFLNRIVADSENAQTYLRLITFGKLPKSIPYSKTLELWQKNQSLNDVNFGVPSLILEVILSVVYRYKDNVSLKFSKVIGRPNSNVSEYDYEMASIRSVCQYASTFSAITFEDMDSMITASVNRLRDKKEESESPVENLFKM